MVETGCRDDCQRTDRYKRVCVVGRLSFWQLPEAAGFSPFFFRSGLRVDSDPSIAMRADPPHLGPAADSPPRSISPPRLRGLSLIDLLDEAADPLSGIDTHLSVSSSALCDSSRRQSDPNRYPDTLEFPTVTLPAGRLLSRTGVRLGDFVAAISTTTERLCFAVVGDFRPVAEGVGSICLARSLGLDPTRRQEPAARDGIIYLVFPGSGEGQGTIPSLAKVRRLGSHHFYRGIWVRGGTIIDQRPEGATSPHRSWTRVLADCFADSPPTSWPIDSTPDGPAFESDGVSA